MPPSKKHFIKRKCTFLAPLFTESGKARFSKISIPFFKKTWQTHEANNQPLLYFPSSFLPVQLQTANPGCPFLRQQAETYKKVKNTAFFISKMNNMA